MKKVTVIQDESSHWYILPSELVDNFRNDHEDEDFIDSGGFDDKYSEYRTGGGPNETQLYIKK